MSNEQQPMTAEQMAEIKEIWEKGVNLSASMNEKHTLLVHAPSLVGHLLAEVQRVTEKADRDFYKASAEVQRQHEEIEQWERIADTQRGAIERFESVIASFQTENDQIRQRLSEAVQAIEGYALSRLPGAQETLDRLRGDSPDE